MSLNVVICGSASSWCHVQCLHDARWHTFYDVVILYHVQCLHDARWHTFYDVVILYHVQCLHDARWHTFYVHATMQPKRSWELQTVTRKFQVYLSKAQIKFIILFQQEEIVITMFYELYFQASRTYDSLLRTCAVDKLAYVTQFMSLFKKIIIQTIVVF